MTFGHRRGFLTWWVIFATSCFLAWDFALAVRFTARRGRYCLGLTVSALCEISFPFSAQLTWTQCRARFSRIATVSTTPSSPSPGSSSPSRSFSFVPSAAREPFPHLGGVLLRSIIEIATLCSLASHHSTLPWVTERDGWEVPADLLCPMDTRKLDKVGPSRGMQFRTCLLTVLRHTERRGELKVVLVW